MKLGLVVLVVFAAMACTIATESTPELKDPAIDREIMEVAPTLIRNKRFTCDLLSFGARGLKGWNHAACAAKCTATRHKGGHCKGAECKCGSRW